MYTKGPWKQAEGNKTFIYALNDKGYNRFWFTLQSAFNEHEATQEELEANADLIAAAPELLEALEDTVAELQSWWDDQDGYGTDGYEEWIPKLHILIAKAKGLDK